MRADFHHLTRTAFFRSVARALVVLLVLQNVPSDAFRARLAAADGTVLWVDHAGTCGGEAPCFTTIQAAIDAVQSGQTVRVMAGQYQEQLRITGKNAGALAVEGNRITIEADPAAGVGDVVLHGAPNQCQGGRAITFQHSSFVTVRGFRIENAGRRGIVLRGGSGGGVANRLERNRLHVGSDRECLGGIDIGRGNADTVIASNVLSGIRRQAIRFRGNSGRAYVVGNTLVRNESNAIFLARGAQVSLWNNVIVQNGARRNGRGGKRAGIRFLRAPKPPADPEVDLRNNLICGNARREIQGPALGAGDTGNVTPSGSEGPSVVANPDCADLAKVFFDLDGADDQLDSVDDDFSLAGTSPAADAGLDPRAQGTGVANEVFEADYLAPSARPGGPEFDMGAVEITGPRPTRTATPSPTPTVSQTPSATPSPTPTVTASPTRTATATVTTTATPSSSATKTATPVVTASVTATVNAATATRTATPAGPIATATPTPTRTTTPVRTATGTPTVTATPTATTHVLPENDHYEVVLGQTLTVPAPGVLANDLDQLGHQLTSNKLSDPDKGTLNAFGTDGGFTFTAPPTYPNPPLQPVARFLNPNYLTTVHRVVDVTGDGKPDVLVHTANPLVDAIDGATGATLWEKSYGTLPPPNNDCGIDSTQNKAFAVGDLDDDGVPEIVLSGRCQRDGGGVGDRYVIVNARTGDVERITDPLTVVPATTQGVTTDGGVTIARLAPGAAPSIVVGAAADHSFGDCSLYAPGAPGQGYHCRVVYVVDGVTGKVTQRMFTTSVSRASLGDGIGHEWPAPIVYDLDGDGQLEIVYAGAVFHQDGSLAWEWPNSVSRTAMANLDDDADPEVVMLTLRDDGHLDGLHVFEANGDERWRFPLPDTNVWGELAIADVDRDGFPEILLTFYDYGTSRDVVLVLDRDGLVKWIRSFPSSQQFVSDFGVHNRPAVYDLDGDGVPEVLVQRRFELSFLDGTDGSTEAAFPFTEGDIFFQTAPSVADLDGNGHAEVVLSRSTGFSGQPSTGLWVLRGANDDWRPVQGTDNQTRYYGANVGAAGAIPYPQARVFADPRTNVFGQQAPWPYLQSFVGRDATHFLYEATDGAGSAPAEVSIDILPQNRPPRFASTPPTVYQPNQPFTYGALAVDPDAGDTITYSIIFASSAYADRCSIDATSGVFSCTIIGPPFAMWPVQIFTLAATDGQGAVATQTVRLEPSSGNGTVPKVVGMQQAAAQNAIVAAGFTVGTVASYQSPYPAGQVITQAPPGGQKRQLGSSVQLQVSLGPPLDPRDVDDDGDGYSENQGDCDDGDPSRNPGAADTIGDGIDENCDGIDGVLPIASIAVTPTNDVIVTGDDLAFAATATLTDGTSADVTAIVVWQSSTAAASISTSGEAHGLAVGTTTISATRGAITGSTSLGVLARAVGDQTDPIAIITSPAAGSEVTQPIDVIGTADDGAFLKYELAVAPADDPDATFTVIATDTAPVVNGVLGRFDPTLLPNDQYVLRLTVFDRGDNQAATERLVVVAGNMKVGQFTQSFEDVALPVTGLPLGIERTYDSRDKRRGDFGVGWRLDLNSIRIRTNRVLGTGWARNVMGANVSLVATDFHRVTVTLPGNFVERFDLEVAPTSNLGSLDFTNVTGFTPMPGTLGTLTALENPSLLILSGGPEDVLADDQTLAAYDPQLFRYTMIDGTQVDLHRKEGIKRLADTNGNTVTFGPNGIVHSAGAAITLTRDAENRITQIVDSAGAQTYTYDARGDLRTHTDRSGATTEFFYDRRHNLLRIVDPLGRPRVRNEYDDDGRLIAVTDAKGNRTEVTHDLNGRREIMRDPLGRFTTLDYDARGNVVASTDPLGHTTTFTYDAADNRLTETDPLGRTTTHTWDAKRNELSVTDPLGRTTTRTYGAFEKVLTKTDPLGRTTAQTLDARGNPTVRTNALGHTEILGYDASGNIASVTNELGRVTGIQYDSLGRRIGITHPDGTSVTIVNDAAGRPLSETGTGGVARTLAYDPMGRPTTIGDGGSSRTLGYDSAGRLTNVTTRTGEAMTYVNDENGRPIEIRREDGTLAASATYDAIGNIRTHVAPSGAVVHFDYDDADRLIATTFPGGGVEQRTYDAAGQLVTVTDALGKTTTYEYDAAGRRIRTIDALGGIATTDYDEVGNVVAETDPLGRTTQFAYDATNRLVLTTFPDGRTEGRSYDAANQLTQIVDPAGHTRTFSHDVMGHLVSVTDELGHVTTLEVDQANHTTTVEDANGHRTVYTVDTQGRLVSTTRPGGQSDTITYDAAGREKTRTNGNGETLTFAYDTTSALPTSLILPGGATETYTWAPGGLIATATDARGTTRFDYDAANRLERATEPDGSYVRYAYDLLGRRTLVAHALSGGPEEVTQYGYDALGRLVEVIDPAGGVTAYTRDAAGQETLIERPNGTTTETAYDPRGRVTAIVHRDPLGGILESFTYTIDALGNRISETRADGSRVEYEYDAASRLVAERRFAPGGATTGEITYAYDAVGNVVTRDGDLGNATFTYDDDDQLLSGAGIQYTYDAAGNRITAGPPAGQLTRFRFDARGRMVRVEPPAGDPTDYTYDFDGTRLASEGPEGNLEFLVDRASPTELTQVLRESDTGQTVRSYVYGTDMLGQSEPGGTIAYRHADALGSTRLLTEASGATTDAYEYAGYGDLLAHAGSSSARYRFAGEPQDPESGLYQLRARYYDAKPGRFLSRDPAGGDPSDPRSLNDYAYAHANPTNLTDPSGRSVPTSLPELLTAIRTQAQLRYNDVQNFIRTEKRVADVSGDIIQRIAAACSVLALLEEIENPRTVRMFFGNLLPGGGGVGRVLLGATELANAAEIGSSILQLMASARLLQTAIAMFSQNMEYRVDDLTACEGPPRKPTDPPLQYFAVAVRHPGGRHIELCPGFIGLDNMPRDHEAVFGEATDASKMGVMVHEWTHMTFGAKDTNYLCRNARNLSGLKAVENADNYRCWVEHSYFSAGKPVHDKVFGD